MKAIEIIKKVEAFCPKEYAYSWDNIGLLSGDAERDVKKIYLTLDITRETVQEAVDSGADMILSHHPILFQGLKRIDYHTAEGQMLRLILQNDLVVYAAHTNMDVAPNGINQRLALLFGLQGIRVLEEHPQNQNFGLGRIGILTTPVNFRDFCEMVKKTLHTPFVRIAGDPNQIIRTVAIGSGSCSELIPLAVEKQADVIVTGDLKYHETMEYTDKLCLIDAGHYPTEICVMDIFADILNNCEGLTLLRSTHPDTFQIV